MDDEILLLAKEDFMREISLVIRKRIAELRDEVDPEWARKRRIAFLKASMAEIIEMLFHLLENHANALHRKQTLAAMLTHAEIREKVKKILRLQLEIFDLRGRDASPGSSKSNRDRISSEDIQRAKEFPFSELIELQRNNMALCPFHADRTPSFHVKNNYGHCFGCGWRGDTIGFIMERDGKNFVDAVRSLI